MGVGDRVPETGSVGTDVGAPEAAADTARRRRARGWWADRWSDTNLVLAVRGNWSATVAEWTRWLDDDCRARHQW